MPADAKQVLTQYQQLKDQRAVWENEWEDIAAYVLPRKRGVTGVRAPGERRTTRIMDSTALKANSDLASAMQGTLTPETIRWFTLRFRNTELNRIVEVQQWLETASERMWETFEQSNFAGEVHELYLDLGAFGTSAMFITEMPIERPKFNGFLFRAIPIGSYVVAEDRTEAVDTFMYQIQMSAKVIAERWPTKVPQPIQNAMDAKKWFEPFSIIHAIYPRDKDDRGDGPPNKLPAMKKPWASVYLFNMERQETVLEESGFNTQPFVIPRWTKLSGEPYGRGPSHDALPDILTLNKARELVLKQWNKVVDPPVLIRDRSVINPLQLFAGGTTVVKMPVAEAITVLESKARFDVNAVNIEDLKGSIRRIFFADQINYPTSLRPGAKTPPSAAEVRAGIEVMHRILGPTLGRFHIEALWPIIDRTFDMMLFADAFPPLPDVVLEAIQAGEAELDVEYIGPLAQTQRRVKLQAIDETYGRLAPLAEVDPGILDAIKTEAVGLEVATLAGMDPRLLRTEDEVAEIRQSRIETAQKQQQTAQFEQLM
ncbi:MAG TPA: portal protein, partial [Dehalococcoidia bacterium]|nr:portal protein [Dehalococcoidia bacterium]